MTDFTKGPWTTTNKRPRRVVREGGKVIANAILHNGAGGKKDGHKSLREAMANANLIASAPDLYAALAALMGGDEKMQVGIGGNPTYVDRFVVQANAALAKARGETVNPKARGDQSDER